MNFDLTYSVGGIGTITINKSGSIRSFDAGSERIFGYMASEVIGQNIAMLMPEPHRSEHDNFIARYLREGNPRVIGQGREVQGRRKDGSSTALHLFVGEVNVAGEPMFFGILYNVAEQKNVEKSQAQFSAIIKSSTDAIISKTLDGIITSWNPAAEILFGYTELEMIGQSIIRLIPPERADEEPLILAKIRRGEHVEHFETIRRRKNGETIPISVTISPIKDGAGTIIGVSKIARDITDLRAAEQETVLALDRLKGAEQIAHIGNWDWNISAGTLVWSDEIYRIFGLRPQQFGATYEAFLESVHPDDRSVVTDGVNHALPLGGPPYQVEHRLVRPSGEVRIVRETGRIYRNEKGEPQRMLGVVLDITDLKEAEEEMRRAHAEAEKANHAKSLFLASMSHEIRTPMNAIIGMAELMGETPLTDEQKKYIKVLSGAGEALLALINDILDISKIESDQFTLDPAPCDLIDTLENCMDIIAVRSQEKKLELVADIDHRLPPLVQADAGRIRQIIINLMGNAVKFTDQGEVQMTVELKGISDGIAEVCIKVKDTGIGMSPEQILHLFRPFTQADASVTRRFGGTGLGLAISKRLIEKMDGTILVESEPGKGSVFSFNVKLTVLKAKAVPLEFLPRLAGKRVLLADRNASSRGVLEKILSSADMTVTAVAVEEDMLRAVAAQSFDAIVQACYLDNPNGCATSEKIRRLPTMANIPILGIASNSRCAHTDKAMRVGMKCAIVKPVKRTEILSGLAAILRGPAPASPSPATLPKEEMVLPSIRILLVEDTRDNRLLIQSYLKRHPAELVMAEDGQQGVDAFIAGTFDIVLMDIQIPVKDGYTATREIREWERRNGRASTPIVALTAHAMKEDEIKSREAGCTAHVTKPIKKQMLIETVMAHLPAKKTVS